MNLGRVVNRKVLPNFISFYNQCSQPASCGWVVFVSATWGRQITFDYHQTFMPLSICFFGKANTNVETAYGDLDHAWVCPVRSQPLCCQTSTYFGSGQLSRGLKSENSTGKMRPRRSGSDHPNSISRSQFPQFIKNSSLSRFVSVSLISYSSGSESESSSSNSLKSPRCTSSSAFSSIFSLNSYCQ